MEHRRAGRLRVRLPLAVTILNTEETPGGARYVPAFDGYTRDISTIGIAFVLPGAPLDDRALTRKSNRLRIVLELPTGPAEVSATAVHQKQVSAGGAEKGWLIGARITKMSPEDRGRLLTHLGTRQKRLKPKPASLRKRKGSK